MGSFVQNIESEQYSAKKTLKMTNKILISLLLLPVLVCTLSANTITVLEMDGMIAGGFLSYLEREIEYAEKTGSSAVLILLNTPGGLVDTMTRMNEVILNADLPVIVYVYPSGGMAASAGAFIVLASDIAAMSPVTTIGSAQPVSITPEGATDAGEKTRKFLSGQAGSLAENKNRPVDIANDFVEHNLALSALEALDKGVIEYVADSIADLLKQIDNTKIEKKDKVYLISTENYTLDYRQIRQSEAVRQWLSNPQIAMLFLMLGMMGLYIGFSTPGTLVPEVLGGIALILGIVGLGLFETNIVGIILLIGGVSLIIAELFTAGFGILGIGGIISLIIGGLLLPVEPLMGVDWYGTFIATVIGAGIGVGIILIFVVQRIIATLRHPQINNLNLSLPQKGTVVEELSPEGKGMIKAKGELWRAKSSDGKHIAAGVEVKVLHKKGDYLIVELSE